MSSQNDLLGALETVLALANNQVPDDVFQALEAAIDLVAGRGNKINALIAQRDKYQLKVLELSDLLLAEQRKVADLEWSEVELDRTTNYYPDVDI
jgi:hypothetical protein